VALIWQACQSRIKRLKSLCTPILVACGHKVRTLCLRSQVTLGMTRVPAPSVLGARRCGFSLGRRVASSGPVACSSSSSSSSSSSYFFSRPKGYTNGRTVTLRTRADSHNNGQNGGRDTAHHPMQRLLHRPPPLSNGLNGILRSDCPALLSGVVSTRSVESSDRTSGGHTAGAYTRPLFSST